MPSFVVHYVAGEKLLKNIKDEESRKLFRTGNLIADATPKYEEHLANLSSDDLNNSELLHQIYLEKQNEKHITHFRDDISGVNIIVYPNLDKFLNKYRQCLNDYLVLGYFFHLYLDYYYFTKILPSFISLYDETGSEIKTFTNLDTNKEYTIKINKSGNIVSLGEFFSEEGLYNDYIIFNRDILKRYDFECNKINRNLFAENNDAILETKGAKIGDILDIVDEYIKQSNQLNEEYNIIDEQMFFCFVDEIVEKFSNEYLEKNKK